MDLLGAFKDIWADSEAKRETLWGLRDVALWWIETADPSEPSHADLAALRWRLKELGETAKIDTWPLLFPFFRMMVLHIAPYSYLARVNAVAADETNRVQEGEADPQVSLSSLLTLMTNIRSYTGENIPSPEPVDRCCSGVFRAYSYYLRQSMFSQIGAAWGLFESYMRIQMSAYRHSVHVETGRAASGSSLFRWEHPITGSHTKSTESPRWLTMCLLGAIPFAVAVGLDLVRMYEHNLRERNGFSWGGRFNNWPATLCIPFNSCAAAPSVPPVHSVGKLKSLQGVMRQMGQEGGAQFLGLDLDVSEECLRQSTCLSVQMVGLMNPSVYDNPSVFGPPAMFGPAAEAGSAAFVLSSVLSNLYSVLIYGGAFAAKPILETVVRAVVVDDDNYYDDYDDVSRARHGYIPALVASAHAAVWVDPDRMLYHSYHGQVDGVKCAAGLPCSSQSWWDIHSIIDWAVHRVHSGNRGFWSNAVFRHLRLIDCVQTQPLFDRSPHKRAGYEKSLECRRAVISSFIQGLRSWGVGRVRVKGYLPFSPEFGGDDSLVGALIGGNPFIYNRGEVASPIELSDGHGAHIFDADDHERLSLWMKHVDAWDWPIVMMGGEWDLFSNLWRSEPDRAVRMRAVRIQIEQIIAFSRYSSTAGFPKGGPTFSPHYGFMSLEDVFSAARREVEMQREGLPYFQRLEQLAAYGDVEMGKKAQEEVLPRFLPGLHIDEIRDIGLGRADVIDIAVRRVVPSFAKELTVLPGEEDPDDDQTYPDPTDLTPFVEGARGTFTAFRKHLSDWLKYTKVKKRVVPLSLWLCNVRFHECVTKTPGGPEFWKEYERLASDAMVGLDPEIGPTVVDTQYPFECLEAPALNTAPGGGIPVLTEWLLAILSKPGGVFTLTKKRGIKFPFEDRPFSRSILGMLNYGAYRTDGAIVFDQDLVRRAPELWGGGRGQRGELAPEDWYAEAHERGYLDSYLKEDASFSIRVRFRLREFASLPMLLPSDIEKPKDGVNTVIKRMLARHELVIGDLMKAFTTPLAPTPRWAHRLPDGYRLLITGRDLYREKEEMRHCIVNYADTIREGLCYVIAARLGRLRATIELVPRGASSVADADILSVKQIKGVSNYSYEETPEGERLVAPIRDTLSAFGVSVIN